MKPLPAPDSGAAWLRLAVTILIATIGGVGMWSVVVALPAVQAEFGVGRAEVSLAFTLTMVGGATGGVAMGRLLDRSGILPVLLVGAAMLALGYVGAAYAGSFAAYAIAQIVIGFGSSIALGPLMADISHWFVRRRGVAVTLTSAGNYVAGTLWSPVVQHLIASVGWRSTHAGIGIASAAAIVFIGLIAMRGRAPDTRTAASAVARNSAAGAL
jgi:MFS family permease